MINSNSGIWEWTQRLEDPVKEVTNAPLSSKVESDNIEALKTLRTLAKVRLI